MRTLTPAGRKAEAQKRLITGIKSALRADDVSLVVSLVGRYGPRLGLPKTLRGELTTIITGRLTNTLSHQEASSRLTDLAHHTPTRHLPHDTWLTLENLARSIGCFHASHSFTQHAHQHALSHNTPSAHQFLSHLHQRQLDDATTTWKRLPRHITHSAFGHDASHYLWLWSNETTGNPRHSSDPTWTHLIHNHHITILGPAPTSHTPPPTPHLTARVIVPGVTSWAGEDDPAGGRCDIAYANSRSTKWFMKNAPLSTFDPFTLTCFRTDKWRTLGQIRGRTAQNHQHLLPLATDRTNMIPLMMWDILLADPASLTIAGTTFFATATAYTESNLRFTHSNRGRADETGSGGTLFERCRSFSHHAVTAHLALVANLVDAGVVTIDLEGREVIQMSAEDYLTRLDALYGVDRK